ncbi:proline racemase family protein [Candidatus Bipolaricaulota bacterium]|nr:proline racemase family protein [Candidatus Bipolaricaulota bacterium]
MREDGQTAWRPEEVSTALAGLRDEAFAVAVDAHTAGEPIRVILSGYSEQMLEADSMAARQVWLKENADEFRTRTMLEPRGHAAMFGAIVTEPTRDDADVGVLFPYPAGFADMCGHGSIGVATVLTELGLLPAQEGKNEIVLDTPAGLVTTVVHYQGGVADRVDLFGTPSYFVDSVTVSLEGEDDVRVDVSFGGNFFGIVTVDQVDLSITPENISLLNDFAHRIMKKINAREDLRYVHPETGEVSLERIRFVEGGSGLKNIVIHEGAVIDRSPCGTGTCSQLAREYHKGDIAKGEKKTYQSVTGTEFLGEVVEEKEEGGEKIITPKVTGSSYITGVNYFVASRGDPLVNGFSVTPA